MQNVFLKQIQIKQCEKQEIFDYSHFMSILFASNTFLKNVSYKQRTEFPHKNV